MVASSALRAAAVGLLARQPQSLAADKRRLSDLLTPRAASEIKLAAVQTLARVGDDGLPDTLLKGWAVVACADFTETHTDSRVLVPSPGLFSLRGDSSRPGERDSCAVPPGFAG